MKRNILDRYRKTASGQFIIDITAGKVADLYDDFDRQAPYIVKELDAGLVEYITESVIDIGNEDFVIRFSLTEAPEPQMMTRVHESIRSYFLYLRDIQVRELKRTIRTSMIFFVVGMAIMFVSVWVNQGVNDSTSVAARVFAEGLTVASWVAMWEALANFLINWRPYRGSLKRYQRIAAAAVEFAGEHTS